MRLFVAVELTDEARQEVAALQAELRKAGADVNWVEPKNLHLTLKFLGEVGEDRLPALKEALEQSALHHPPFTLSLEGVGAFPRARHPRVIRVGIQEGSKALTALAAPIEEACGRLGFPAEERPFSPHLTIGRVRPSTRLSARVKRMETVPFKAGRPIRVDRFVLFQSVLSPHGPIYTPLAQILFPVSDEPNEIKAKSRRPAG